jgi:hypothetical protein
MANEQNQKAFSSHPGHGNSKAIAAQAQREVSGPTVDLAADKTKMATGAEA